MLQIGTIVLMVMVKHSDSSPKSKVVMSLQHLRKEVRDEVDILVNDKHQSFLQVDFKIFCISLLQGGTVIIDEGSNILKVLKVARSQYLYNISKRS